MSAHPFLSIDSLRHWFGDFAPQKPDGLQIHPGDLFPNFKLQASDSCANFWEMAEGSWTYLYRLPVNMTDTVSELLNFAFASTMMAEEGINVFALSEMRQEELIDLRRDVSAIAGTDLLVTLVADPDRSLSYDLGLIVDDYQALSKTVHRAFHIGPDLRVRTIEGSSSPIAQGADEILRKTATLQSLDAEIIRQSTNFLNPTKLLPT